jgi:hypothetical protein
MGVFEGGAGEAGVFAWCFCGDCVVNRGWLMVDFAWLENLSDFQNISVEIRRESGCGVAAAVL